MLGASVWLSTGPGAASAHEIRRRALERHRHALAAQILDGLVRGELQPVFGADDEVFAVVFLVRQVLDLERSYRGMAAARLE